MKRQKIHFVRVQKEQRNVFIKSASGLLMSNNLYSSHLVTRVAITASVIKWRRMRWAGHVARMGEERGCIGSWWGNRREGAHWEDLGVDGWIILGWISRRWDVGIWTGLG